MQADWKKIIDYLKSEECTAIHLWYSSAEEWAYISYKAQRQKITSEWTLQQVKVKVFYMITQKTRHAYKMD